MSLAIYQLFAKTILQKSLNIQYQNCKINVKLHIADKYIWRIKSQQHKAYGAFISQAEAHVQSILAE